MSVYKPTITITLIVIELSNSVMQKNKSQMLPVLTGRFEQPGFSFVTSYLPLKVLWKKYFTTTTILWKHIVFGVCFPSWRKGTFFSVNTSFLFNVCGRYRAVIIASALFTMFIEVCTLSDISYFGYIRSVLFCILTVRVTCHYNEFRLYNLT